MFVSELTNLIAKSKNMKKESLSIIMAKILLAAIIFVEAGVIVTSGGKLIGDHREISKPVKKDIVIANDGTKGEKDKAESETTKPKKVNSPYVKIISPNGGEEWLAENIYDIIWESEGVDKINITIAEGGHDRGLVVSEFPAESGKYSWKIDPSLAYSESGVSQAPSLRVMIYDYQDGKICDQSDGSFRIIKKNKKENETANWQIYKSDPFTLKYSSEIWNLKDKRFFHKRIGDSCMAIPGGLWRNNLYEIIDSEDISINGYKARKVKLAAGGEMIIINVYFDVAPSKEFSLSLPKNKQDKQACENDFDEMLSTIKFEN